jgi:hypothetical protein
MDKFSMCIAIEKQYRVHNVDSYREDLFVGYKHYQARNVKPLFPFGYKVFIFLLYNISCLL